MVWLIPTLPLGAALVLVTASDRLPRRAASLLIRGTMVFTVAIALLIAYDVVQRPATNRQTVHRLYTWFEAGDLSVDVALRVDPISAAAAVAASAGMALALWSSNHDADRARARRIRISLSLLAFALLVLILADNFLVLYLAWELADWMAYLALALWTGRPVTLAPSERLFLVPRLGDVGLFFGLVALSVQMGSLRVADVGLRASALAPPVAVAVGLIILAGSAAKVLPFLSGVWYAPNRGRLPALVAWGLSLGLASGGLYLVARIWPLFST